MDLKSLKQTDELEVPNQAINALCAALGERLIAVVLYGSRARHEADEDSDWDLLVIARGLPKNYWERHLFFVQALPVNCRSRISVLARTPEEFERRISSLYLDIALDGEILYDRERYVEPKLQDINHTIDRAGLHREHSRAGDMWLWKEQQPLGAWSLEWEE